jgi:hypothetical protein
MFKPTLSKRTLDKKKQQLEISIDSNYGCDYDPLSSTKKSSSRRFGDSRVRLEEYLVRKSTFGTLESDVTPPVPAKSPALQKQRLSIESAIS